MSRGTLVTVKLWQVQDTGRALLCAVEDDINARQVWIPLSLIERISRKENLAPVAGARNWPQVEIVLPEWKAGQCGLEY